jgi:hypothetical protein
MQAKILIAFMFILSLEAKANEERNWQVKVTESYKNFSTTYEDSSEFGITCKEKCFYYLIPKNKCIKDGEDLTLINNFDGKTLLVKNKCVQQDEVNLYIFDSFDEITKLIKNDDTVQFIHDLNSNKTNQVTSYSISGFKSVISKYFADH